MLYAKGDLIGGNYEVREVLGAGGFGVVYLVYSRELNKLLALKTFKDEFIDAPAVRDLFRKEASLWISIGEHPFVVQAYFVEEIDGRLFVASEFVAALEGGLKSLSLDKLLKLGPVDIKRVLLWSVELCLGMEFAYRRGVRCHRDLKPSNVLITKDGTAVKVSDFGLAGALLGRERSDRLALDIRDGRVGLSCQTMHGFGVGTPTHMPPEQFLDGSSCDERSDIYSFGITLFEMVEGRLPFLAPLPQGDSEDEGIRFQSDMFRLHCDARIPISDSPLAGAISRCLQKRPESRYQSFKQLREDLSSTFRDELPAQIDELGKELSQFEGRELDAEEWNNKGTSLLAFGDTRGAIRCFSRALEVDPSLPTAWTNKGVALEQVGRLEEAVECYDRAVSLAPSNSKSWDNKGAGLCAMRRYGEALSCFDQAVRLNPASAPAWLNRGTVLGQLGRTADAVECFFKALSINPADLGAWLKIGSLLFISGRLEEAVDALKQAISIDPRNAQVLFMQGDALSRLGRPHEALPYFEKAVQIEPRIALAWFGKGVVEDALGHSGPTVESFSKFLLLAGDSLPAERDHAAKRLKHLKNH